MKCSKIQKPKCFKILLKKYEVSIWHFVNQDNPAHHNANPALSVWQAKSTAMGS